MGKWIKANGEIESVEPLNGEYFTLDELKRFVGGYIQVINLPIDLKLMICNEKGKILNLPKNNQATDILVLGNGIMLEIVGDVFVCDYNEMK
jgi:hypothetical protein